MNSAYEITEKQCQAELQGNISAIARFEECFGYDPYDHYGSNLGLSQVTVILHSPDTEVSYGGTD